MSDTIDPDFKLWAEAIGVVVITWSHAENMLALSNAIIGDQTGSVAGFNELPVNLKGRIKFCRKALSSKPILQSIKDEGGLLLDKFMALKDRRHALIHGAAAQINGADFQILRFSSVGNEATTWLHNVTLMDLVAFQVEVMNLADAAAAFIGNLSALFPE